MRRVTELVKRLNIMDASMLVLTGLALGAAGLLVWRSGLAGAADGSRVGMEMFLGMLPRLLVAFLLAGLVQALIPREVIAATLSDASGLRAIVIGSVAGAITPGGPFVSFPLLAAVYKMGAGSGAIAAFLTSWAVIGVHRALIWELPLLGARLTVTRLVVSLPLPILVGWVTRWILRAPVP